MDWIIHFWNSFSDVLITTIESMIFVLGLTAILLPQVTKLKVFRSKRDPYFWRKNAQKGSPLWVSANLSLLLFISLMAANFATPAANELYADFFGIGRGGLSGITNSLDLLQQNYLDILYVKHLLNPFNWREYLNIFPIWWTVTFIVFLGLGSWNMRRRYLNTKDQTQEEYGGATFTEPFEVKKQYQSVPDRGFSFDGYGGVPIMHSFNWNLQGWRLYLATVRPKVMPKEFYKYPAADVPNDTPKSIPGRYFIDGKAVNTIIVGETRSGKGETEVLATIDIVARGRNDQSLVVADLKGELFTKTNEDLKRNNYDVRVLNFDNLSYSMSMNLLSQTLYYAKKGNYARARTKIGQLANTIFPSDDADFKNRFWTNGSSATFTGLTLATLWFMREEDEWDKVTVGNVVEMLTQLATDSVETTVDGKLVTRQNDKFDEFVRNRIRPQTQTQTINKLDFLVSVMTKKASAFHNEGKSDELLDMAIASFNQAGMGSAETKGNIYASMFSDVQLFIADINVRKLTSMNNFRYSSVGFPRIMELQLPGEFGDRKALIAFTANGQHNEEVVIADEMGLIQFAIEPKLDDYTTFTVTFDLPDNDLPSEKYPDLNIVGHRIEIVAKKLYRSAGLKGKQTDPYTGLPIIDGYQVVEQGITTDIKGASVLFDYSEKRTAIFVVLPPLSKQYYQLAIFFLEQLYQENFDWANRNKKRNINRVHFLLDKFGNLPKWPGMDTKLSAALGYNFAFSIILQNLEQLDTVYGKELAGTIVANSSNFFYIKTSSTTTAEELSKRLGNRTITMWSAGRDTKREDSTSSQVKERALLNMQELMSFRPSQMLAFRSAKNDDLRGAQVDTNPIYNYGWYAMPFAFNLLRGYISDSAELSRVEVDSPHRFIDLERLRVNYNQLLDKLYLNVFTNGKVATLPENSSNITVGTPTSEDTTLNDKKRALGREEREQRAKEQAAQYRRQVEKSNQMRGKIPKTKKKETDVQYIFEESLWPKDVKTSEESMESAIKAASSYLTSVKMTASDNINAIAVSRLLYALKTGTLLGEIESMDVKQAIGESRFKELTEHIADAIKSVSNN